MAIRKRGKVYWVDFSFNKFRYRKRSPENTFQGAKAYELLLQQKLARGEPIDDAPEDKNKSMIFKDFVEEFFERYVKVNNKLSEIRSKRCALDAYLIPSFGKLNIKNITSVLSFIICRIQFL